MSAAENNHSEVQVGTPPRFGPSPYLSQSCRSYVAKENHLQPFRQDRLTRLPQPPKAMATSSDHVNSTALLAWLSSPKEVKQLIKDIMFLKEDHARMLKSLQDEISDLKQKNQQLQFQVISGCPALPPPSESKNEDKAEVLKLQQKIDSLQQAIETLRSALKNAMASNTNLNNEVQALKRNRNMLLTNLYQSTSRAHQQIDHGNPHSSRVPHAASPEMDDYGASLKQIQRAAGSRASKSGESQLADHPNNYWGKNGNAYMENRHHHHYMMPGVHHEPQLPRLPLRSQLQNYMPRRHDMQYDQLSSNILPTLKQPDKSHPKKKTRGPGQAQLRDTACKH